MTDLLDVALSYARRGWPVLPCEPKGKRPCGRLVCHGVKEASTDPGVIKAWWAGEPSANVGLATGTAFDVLDIDGDEAMAVLVTEMPWDAPTIDGPTVATGRGTHCYVATTGLGNRAGFLPGCDWRGQGGYVVAAPSVHPNGAVYRWHCGAEDPEFGVDAPIHPAPRWLLDLLMRHPEPVAPAKPIDLLASRASAYGQRALESEVGRLLLVPVRARNDQLNRSAFALGQMVASDILTFDEVVSALLVAAERIGLTRREAEATIASGLLSAADHPRSVPA
jgi:hypothetical protein